MVGIAVPGVAELPTVLQTGVRRVDLLCSDEHGVINIGTWLRTCIVYDEGRFLVRAVDRGGDVYTDQGGTCLTPGVALLVLDRLDKLRRLHLAGDGSEEIQDLDDAITRAYEMFDDCSKLKLPTKKSVDLLIDNFETNVDMCFWKLVPEIVSSLILSGDISSKEIRWLIAVGLLEATPR